jgi:hypothetical protein
MTRDEKLADIREHPERHQHDFAALTLCSTVDGALDTTLVDAHSGITGRSNGGVQCDVNRGPCSCGAWH